MGNYYSSHLLSFSLPVSPSTLQILEEPLVDQKSMTTEELIYHANQVLLRSLIYLEDFLDYNVLNYSIQELIGNEIERIEILRNVINELFDRVTREQ